MRALVTLLLFLLLPAALTAAPLPKLATAVDHCCGLMADAMDCTEMASGCDSQHQCCPAQLMAPPAAMQSVSPGPADYRMAAEQRYRSIFLSLVDPPPILV